MATFTSRDFSERSGQVQLVQHNGTAIVSLRGEIDLSLRHELQIALAEAIAADRVIVDLSRAVFIDSTTINALVVAHRAARLADVTLTMAPGPDNVMRTLHVSGVADLFNTAQTPIEKQ